MKTAQSSKSSANPSNPGTVSPDTRIQALIKVSLRQNAVYVPDRPTGGAGTRPQVEATEPPGRSTIAPETAVTLVNLKRLGLAVSEPLLRALDQAGPAFQAQLLSVAQEVLGTQKNWTPLVRGWDLPTGESVWDHFVTWLTNLFGLEGTTLACGHVIPPKTFPLERYTGCPFCGTPFEVNALELKGQGSSLKVLELWNDPALNAFLVDLLASKTPLDATQLDSLKGLLRHLALPSVAIGMKETVVAVVDGLVEAGRVTEAGQLFTSPTDILRYLWYKHTGFIQLVEPKVVVRRKSALQRHLRTDLDKRAEASQEAQKALKLKYSRPEGLRVARWLNALEAPVEQLAEIMHPKRELWVRFIRALRLAEHSHRPELSKLRSLLDVLYHRRYLVVGGLIERARLRRDLDLTFRLLKTRPGLFARCLLATMLRLGPEPTLAAFGEVIDKVPLRLLFTLTMFSESYFNRQGQRLVKPLAGSPKSIPTHPMLAEYTDAQLQAMTEGLRALCVQSARARYACEGQSSGSVYIDPALFHMPIPISDRSESVQDLPVALMGTVFSLQSDQLRLFMQWGTGLPAQHMDMDLSCRVVFADRLEVCSYMNLVSTGCKHSGDIRAIPEQVGTAEYVEIDVRALQKAGALYAVFTCNAYSNGALTPNLMVGWMNSAYPMAISAETGVAYDPSCVQHQVRITAGLTKGLVFGVLKVRSQEIVWLELPFEGQVAQQLKLRSVEQLLARLSDKLSVGALLKLRAEARGQTLQETPGADEAFSRDWALNAAGVTRLLLGA